MHDEQIITEHPPQQMINTWYNPAADTARTTERDEKQRQREVFAREAAQREMAMNRAMNPAPIPVVDPRSLLSPVLPDGFDAAKIDQAIYERGVAFDREKLVSLGKQCFAELLEADKRARSVTRVPFSDLTSWPSVSRSFAAVMPLRANIATRTTAEAIAGAGADREAAAQINGFHDLWKVTDGEQETVHNVLGFHDAFVSLIFGQSIVERLSPDGRIHSRLFCGGAGHKVGYFEQWLPALSGEHFKVKLVRPLWSVLAWIAGEKEPLPDSAALAREWLNVRAPSPEHLRLCEAIFTGFFLGLRGWPLWEYVGNRTRQLIDIRTLATWRAELTKRYSKIARFHNKVMSYFWRAGRYYSEHRFDAPAYRNYLDKEFARLLDQVSMIATQTIGSACVARFDGWLLAKGKPKDSITKVRESLENAFTGAHFNVTVEELQ